MADTPSDTPKRRRTTAKKPAEASASPVTTAPATPPAKSAPARKPRKAAAATATEAKPVATRKAAESKPAAPKAATSKADAPKAAASKVTAPKAPAAAKPRRATAATAPKPRRATRRPAPAKAAKPAKAPTAAATPRSSLVSERARDALPDLPPRTGLFAALGTLAAVGGAFFIWRASRADEPRYQTIESDGAFEIRKYPAQVTAGTEARGERQAALNEGFRTLADYIAARSRGGAKIPMTAPVLSDTDRGGSWRTRFVMPADKARAELPATPLGVDLISEPPARVAAIRFSGRADDATLDTKEGALRSWLQLKGLPSEGKAVHAFYNAPFTPGPLRRSEVLIVLSDEGGTGA